MNLIKLLDDVKKLGYPGATIQVCIPVTLEGLQAPKVEEPLPDPVASSDQPATAKTRMWALNRLVAAPGQSNRTLVRKFLWHVGWISGDEEPEAWKLEHVPTNKKSLALLISRITQFEIDAKSHHVEVRE